MGKTYIFIIYIYIYFTHTHICCIGYNEYLLISFLIYSASIYQKSTHVTDIKTVILSANLSQLDYSLIIMQKFAWDRFICDNNFFFFSVM